jgi:glycosyltransferase involved in cell wall biosynthesis
MLAFHRMRKTWQDRVAAYISLTNFSRSKFIEGGIPAAKIFVKPNFVYPDPGTGDSTGNFALFVGRLSPEKGVRTLLRTWLRTPDIPLQIIGGGTLNDEIRTQIMEAGLQRVELRGPLPHDQVLAIMKKACFLLFPSECYENFSLSVLEAFACNLPVIASRLGTMAEIIEDRRTGLLFTPGDSEDLAAKVEWGWTHREEMADMGAEARLEYERKFTANRNYQMLMGIYTGIHHKRRYVFQEDDS